MGLVGFKTIGRPPNLAESESEVISSIFIEISHIIFGGIVPLYNINISAEKPNANHHKTIY